MEFLRKIGGKDKTRSGLEIGEVQGLFRNVMIEVSKRDAGFARELDEAENERGYSIPELVETVRREPEEMDLGKVLEKLAEMLSSRTVNGMLSLQATLPQFHLLMKLSWLWKGTNKMRILSCNGH